MNNSVIRMLERTAERVPDAIAIECGDETVSYGELLERSRAVGTALLAVDGVCVCVFLPKSIECVAAFYGVLCAGKTYVPIDHSGASARIEKIIDQFPAVITDGQGRDKLLDIGVPAEKLLLIGDLMAAAPELERVERAVSRCIDTDPVYIMHTSGSTGVPKGVTIPHRAVADFAVWSVEAYSLTERDVIGLQSPLHFDASVFDLYACMLSGAKLSIMPETLLRYTALVPDYLEERGVTTILWTPSLMVALANSGALEGHALPALRTISFVGEIMPCRQYNIWKKLFPTRLFMNLYGPTETTCASTFYVIDRPYGDGETLPIGYACGNTRVLIVTESGGLAAPGELGELCIMGSGLALGYWNDPEKTAAAFTPAPTGNGVTELMYRTGDYASMDADGLIHFAGRRDTQIKSNGVRVELEDISAAAGCLEGVESVCTLFDTEKQEIVLFLQTASDMTLRQVKQSLRHSLPPYMLPARVACLREFPKTNNGKTDRVWLKKRYIEENEK